MKHLQRLLVPLLMTLCAGAVSSADSNLGAEHIARVKATRRIFVQYDPSIDILKPGGVGGDIDRVMRYVFGYASQPGSQIDAICIDVANEGLAHHRSRILPPIQHPGLLKWRAQGIDYMDRLIAEGHKRGKEIWWGQRMNEVERGHLSGFDNSSVEVDRLNPAKAAHPDWLIRSWWWQGFWNYALKPVRQYRLSLIHEVMQQYDFDGVHLDFLRHTPHLPPGKQWELRADLTEFVADVRAMLQKQAEKRGRPILLAARIPDSLDGAHTDGLDVETWAKLGLVDLLVIGTRTIQVELAPFQKVTAGTGVRLIPSFDTFHATDGYQGPQPMELLRGVFGNYWHQGADGVGIFNYAAGSPEQAAAAGLDPGRTSHVETMSTIGSPATIAGKERVYAVDRRGGYLYGEGYFSSNLSAPLPLTLRNDRSPSSVRLDVWEPVASGTRVRLEVILNQAERPDPGVRLTAGTASQTGYRLSVSVNGQALRQLASDPAWKDPRLFSPEPQPVTMVPRALNPDLERQRLTRVDFEVPVEVLRRGPNAVALSITREGFFPPRNYVQVEKLELRLR